MSDMKDKTCIGFGIHENICDRPIDSNSKYWCFRCNEIRMQHIDKSWAQIFAALKLEPKP